MLNSSCVSQGYGDSLSYSNNFSESFTSISEGTSIVEPDGSIRSSRTERVADGVFVEHVTEKRPDGSTHTEKNLLNFNSSERCGNSILSSETTFSETESQMNKKEDNMSIVGIMLCKDGILAIGDSKATATTMLGTYKELNCDTKKVFIDNSFVLAAYDTNEYFDAKGKIKRVSDWIDWVLSKYDFFDYIEFVDAFHTELCRNHPLNSGKAYTFLIGGKDRFGAFIRSIKITADGLHYGKQFRNAQQSIWGGCAFYRDILCKCNIPEYVEDAASVYKEKIEGLIAEADTFGSYNPVGGPIQTKILRF